MFNVDRLRALGRQAREAAPYVGAVLVAGMYFLATKDGGPLARGDEVELYATLPDGQEVSWTVSRAEADLAQACLPRAIAELEIGSDAEMAGLGDRGSDLRRQLDDAFLDCLDAGA